jgi:hypothetical protein
VELQPTRHTPTHDGGGGVGVVRRFEMSVCELRSRWAGGAW